MKPETFLNQVCLLIGCDRRTVNLEIQDRLRDIRDNNPKKLNVVYIVDLVNEARRGTGILSNAAIDHLTHNLRRFVTENPLYD